MLFRDGGLGGKVYVCRCLFFQASAVRKKNNKPMFFSVLRSVSESQATVMNKRLRISLTNLGDEDSLISTSLRTFLLMLSSPHALEGDHNLNL